MNHINRFSFILILLLVTSSFQDACAKPKSKILNYIGNLLPSYVEFGWMCDIVNTYVQVSEMVRTTNTMIREFKEAREEIEQTSVMITELYDNISNLKNVNLYDMNTWSSYLDNVSISLTWDVRDILNAFDEIDKKTVGNALRYPDKIADIMAYDVRLAKNNQVADKNYIGDKFTEVETRFNQTFLRYSENTIEMLQSLRANEVQQLLIWQEKAASTPEEIALKNNRIKESQDRIKQIDSDIQQVRQGNSGVTMRSKADTLLDLSKNLIAMNMTEIQTLSGRAKEYDNLIRQMNDDYDKLRSGNVNTVPNENPIVTFDNPSFKSEHIGEGADKAPVPSAPTDVVKKPAMSKKNTANKDILHFRNQIDFVLLKQESTLRDIEMIKANTISFIVAFEALRRHKYFDDVVIQSHNARLLQSQIKKARDEITL